MVRFYSCGRAFGEDRSDHDSENSLLAREMLFSLIKIERVSFCYFVVLSHPEHQNFWIVAFAMVWAVLAREFYARNQRNTQLAAQI